MEAPTRTKALLARRHYPLDASALIPEGAVLTTVQMTASIMAPYPLQATTLAAPVVVGDGTVSLNADPGKGARLILEPGSGAEEQPKVLAVSGTGPYICTITPVAWAAHSSGASVSYERGRNARLFVDDTPTPAGTLVTPVIDKGAWNQKYRITYHLLDNSGQTREDEFILQVTDPAGVGPHLKQPGETVDIAGDFEKQLSQAYQAGATLSNPTAYVSANTNTVTTQLGAQANVGATTLTLPVHPGIGAMLILTPAGAGSTPPERVYVSNVTGTAPTFTVTITPDLEFQHSSGADVTVYQGYSSAFLTATTGTIQGFLVINRSRRGQAGKVLKVVWVVDTSQGERLMGSALVSLEEETNA